MAVKLAVFDLDGTLTVAHGDVRLSCCAVRLVRALESSGVKVSIVTGNSLPVALGIARYLGASGPVAAENGCVVGRGEWVLHLCEGRVPRELVDEVLKLGFRESWQNSYRFHEVALIPEDRSLDKVARASEIARSRGFNAVWTGYALHIQPPGGGKLAGLLKVMEVSGVGREEVLVVGDGDNDVEMMSYAAFSGAPGDASPAAKAAALYVAKLPGALGAAEAVERILGVRVKCS
ncbi:MAG: phosphoglycolate phosphatase [Desulfurococcales archaeon]|nr:phosphoglycolate phosphatase [Desulfurococcales archaeon]